MHWYRVLKKVMKLLATCTLKQIVYRAMSLNGMVCSQKPPLSNPIINPSRSRKERCQVLQTVVLVEGSSNDALVYQ